MVGAVAGTAVVVSGAAAAGAAAGAPNAGSTPGAEVMGAAGNPRPRAGAVIAGAAIGATGHRGYGLGDPFELRLRMSAKNQERSQQTRVLLGNRHWCSLQRILRDHLYAATIGETAASVLYGSDKTGAIHEPRARIGGDT